MEYRSFDNSGSLHKMGGHYVIQVGGSQYLYTYIRKNACSAFKNLFLCEGSGEGKNKKGREALDYMNEFYTYDESLSIDIKSRIFVYRDPFERLASLYINKFVERRGNEGIFKDYELRTGKKADDASFRIFCTEYISLLKSGIKLDPHVVPQQWHLLPVLYDVAVDISCLSKAMAQVFGEGVSEKYFAKPVNSTSRLSSICVPHADEIPSKKLYESYFNERVVPDKQSLFSSEIEEVITSTYADDYAMLAETAK